MDFKVQVHPIADRRSRNDLYFSPNVYSELNFPTRVSINDIVFSCSEHKNIKDDCIGITSHYRSRLAKSVGDSVSLKLIDKDAN